MSISRLAAAEGTASRPATYAIRVGGGSVNRRIRSQYANFRGAGYLFTRVCDPPQLRYTGRDDDGRVTPSSTSLLDADPGRTT